MRALMTKFTRYAVYYAPAPGPLAEACAAWLGWDAARGTEVRHPELPGLLRAISEITATPRKYGFHGTLKPPFVPTDTVEALQADLAALAERRAPVTLAGLKLDRLGSFLALIPEGDTSALADLAAACVRDLDAHRAPPSEAELARRQKNRLSARQQEHLAQWGYPYVLEDFRFHLTLSGRLPGDEAEQTLATLRPWLNPLLPRPLVIDALCLFGEDETGRFHLLHRYRLCG